MATSRAMRTVPGPPQQALTALREPVPPIAETAWLGLRAL